MSKTIVKSELLLASKNAMTGDILYTWRLTFPRPILAEINTHRSASRNTSSSRAIPIKKMRNAVMHDTFMPISLGMNQKGMQAGAEITGAKRVAIQSVIKMGAYIACAQSWLLEKLGAHKQVSNRYLEPYSWCTQIFSATDVKNLFLLRNHPAAEPHFHELARQMQEQVDEAHGYFATMTQYGLILRSDKYQMLAPGQWHLPFIDADEFSSNKEMYANENSYDIEKLLKISAARCARTSYNLLDTGKPSTVEADIALCDKLFGSQPMHLSPTEHQAKAMDTSIYCGNYRGFKQYRKEIAGEHGGDRA